MIGTVLWVWLAVSVLSAVFVALHVVGHPQKMWIMDIVWPVTALWAGPVGAAAYWKLGRREKPPLAIAAAKAATHCGAGCTLGDIAAAAFAIAVPFSIAGHALFGEWIYAFVAAYLLGIVFQYFTIAPMRHLGPKEGIIAALKADTLSLVAWQLGMYGWMAIARFVLLGHSFDKSAPFFWVMMQVAMLAGFITSYPVNVMLLRRGLKERM